jgi:putative GTP pyrophosphokinase
VTPEQIKGEYLKELPVLNAWGMEIASRINGQFKPILKMPSSFRVKDLDSLIEKALYRNKGYADPYRDITDRVGVRAIVLLESHVHAVTEWVKSIGIWEWSLDRHFETERRTDPTVFSYQSNHLVLRPNAVLTVGGLEIPAGLPCEVQTLLQHAYSELSHDLIYKSKLLVEPDVKRLAARSMALIETTDRVFLDVHDSISKQEAPLIAIAEVAAEQLRSHGIESWNERVNQVIFDALRLSVRDIPVDELRNFMNDRAFLFEKLKEWTIDHPVFSTPAIIPVLFLVLNKPTALAKSWPYTQAELVTLFSALGRTAPE